MTKDEFDALRVWDRFVWRGMEHTVRDLVDGGVKANTRKGTAKRTFTADDRDRMARVAPDPETWHPGKRPNLRDLEQQTMTPITDEQITEIADRLQGTTGHVYDTAKAVIGRPLAEGEAEALWPRLKEVGGVQKCEECNVWKANDEMTAWGREHYCKECEAEDERAEANDSDYDPDAE